MNDECFDKHDGSLLHPDGVRVSPRTLDAWRAADKGPLSVKVAGRVCWPRLELDRWIASRLLVDSRGGVR
jgi:hypothetical protein